MTMTIPEGMPAAERKAYESGFMTAEDQWRRAAIAIALTLAGGERGMLACRKDGRCIREPQQSLELFIERITLFSAATAPDVGLQSPPATDLLALLQALAQVPDFTPIHLKRQDLRKLLAGFRSLQACARSAVESIAAIEPLSLEHISKIDHGPFITHLSHIRTSLKEILK